MADTTPGLSEQTSSGALFRGAPARLPPEERPGENPGEHKDEPAAADALAQARVLGTELAGALRDSAAALLDEQKTRAANEIATFGEVLHRSVQSLDWRGGRWIGEVGRMRSATSRTRFGTSANSRTGCVAARWAS